MSRRLLDGRRATPLPGQLAALVCESLTALKPRAQVAPTESPWKSRRLALQTGMQVCQRNSRRGTLRRVARARRNRPRAWVRQADIDDGYAPGVSTAESQRVNFKAEWITDCPQRPLDGPSRTSN